MRATIAALSKSKAALIGLVAVVSLAVVGTTVGYAAMSKSVTLSLDGQADTVSATGDTVSEVLDAQGIDVTKHDFVAPSLDEEISDGDRITVRFGRELALSVDGKKESYWVTSTEVAGALSEIGRRFSGADLSTSRSATIGRDGMSLKVITPKTVKVQLGPNKVEKREVTAVRVKGALEEVDAKVDKHDQISPKPMAKIQDGDKIVLTKIHVMDKTVQGESIEADTITRESSSMLEGEEKVTREGRDGLRDATYRLVIRNGEVVTRELASADVTRQPVDQIVTVGTKEPEPEPAPAANYASGGTVWDQLAQCESGGNWAINTGNGYYGGLQFSLSTWQSFGGSGMPHEQSREAQIAVAERIQASQGWGAWPSCASQLGLY